MGKRIDCTVDGHIGEWIERGRVSYKQYNDWRTIEDGDATLALASRILDSWNLTDVDGTPAPQPQEANAFDTLDLRLIPWIIRAISQSFVDDLTLDPQPSAPSPT